MADAVLRGGHATGSSARPRWPRCRDRLRLGHLGRLRRPAGRHRAGHLPGARARAVPRALPRPAVPLGPRQREVGRHDPLPVVRGGSRVCDAPRDQDARCRDESGRSARGAGGGRGARAGGTRRRRPRRARPARCRTSTWPARTASARPATRTSKVWYTVADGVLSDVYYPTIDNTNVETLQYVVTDGATFTDLQTRDMTYTVQSLDRDRDGLPGHQHRASSGSYRWSPTTSPTRAATRVVMQHPAASRPAAADCKVYVRLDATVNGNGGGGAGQRRRRRRGRRHRHRGAWSVSRHRHRRPTPPTATTPSRCTCALRADRPFLAASQRLRRHRQRRAGPARRRPRAGHDVRRARPTATSCRPRRSTPARRPAVHPRARLRHAPQAAAVGTAGAAARTPFDATLGAVRSRLAARTTRAERRRRSLPGLTAAQADGSRGVLPVGQRAEGQRGQDLPGRGRRLAWPARGGRRSAPATCRAASRLLRLLPRGVRPRPVRGVHRAAGRRRRRDRAGDTARSCSSASSWPTAGCRATRWSTARRRPTPAATSSTRRRTRS